MRQVIRTSLLRRLRPGFASGCSYDKSLPGRLYAAPARGTKGCLFQIDLAHARRERHGAPVIAAMDQSDQVSSLMQRFFCRATQEHFTIRGQPVELLLETRE